MKPNIDFNKWVVRVDREMKERFALDTEEAGLEVAQLHRHFESGEHPVEFVEWLGRKHDLEERCGRFGRKIAR